MVKKIRESKIFERSENKATAEWTVHFSQPGVPLNLQRALCDRIPSEYLTLDRGTDLVVKLEGPSTSITRYIDTVEEIFEEFDEYISNIRQRRGLAVRDNPPKDFPADKYTRDQIAHQLDKKCIKLDTMEGSDYEYYTSNVSEKTLEARLKALGFKKKNSGMGIDYVTNKYAVGLLDTTGDDQDDEDTHFKGFYIYLLESRFNESALQRRSVSMVKKISESKKTVNEEFRNFTIVSDADEDGVDFKAKSATDALKDFRSKYKNATVSEVYDEADIHYNPETGDELEESLTEGATKDWEVKQVSFDVAVPAGTDLNAQAMTGNTKFYVGLCKFLESQGFEMAGDIIDSHDMTDIYKSNDYEFFEESLTESFDFDLDALEKIDPGMSDKDKIVTVLQLIPEEKYAKIAAFIVDLLPDEIVTQLVDFLIDNSTVIGKPILRTLFGRGEEEKVEESFKGEFKEDIVYDSLSMHIADHYFPEGGLSIDQDIRFTEALATIVEIIAEAHESK